MKRNTKHIIYAYIMLLSVVYVQFPFAFLHRNDPRVICIYNGNTTGDRNPTGCTSHNHLHDNVFTPYFHCTAHVNKKYLGSTSFAFVIEKPVEKAIILTSDGIISGSASYQSTRAPPVLA